MLVRVSKRGVVKDCLKILRVQQAHRFAKSLTMGMVALPFDINGLPHSKDPSNTGTINLTVKQLTLYDL